MKKKLFDTWIKDNLTLSPTSEKVTAKSITVEKINHLLLSKHWFADEYNLFNFITRKVEIHGRIHVEYTSDGKPKSATRISDEDNELVVILFLRELFNPSGTAEFSSRLKLFNALYKALDISQPSLMSETSTKESLDALFYETIQTEQNSKVATNITCASISAQNAGTLSSELTVLFSEGPIGRAYLSTLANLGIKPKHLIHLVSSINLQTKRPVGRWLPNFLRVSYCENIGYSSIHYWPQRLKKQYPDLVADIKKAVADSLKISAASITEANSGTQLSKYAENVETVFCEGLRDPVLKTYLSAIQPTTLLFTGGGIVNRELIELDQLKYLHIHPGYLPGFRGADCTLWSKMIAGTSSASAIFLDNGIDTGDILSSLYLPRVEIERQLKEVDESTAYRMIYSYVDPWIRAACLQKLLSDHGSIAEMNLERQGLDTGVTFHFMHKKLRHAVIERW